MICYEKLHNSKHADMPTDIRKNRLIVCYFRMNCCSNIFRLTNRLKEQIVEKLKMIIKKQ